MRPNFVQAPDQSSGSATGDKLWTGLDVFGGTSKNGFAPRAALLTALWGDEPFVGKLRLYLFSEAVRTFTGLL